MTAWLPTRPTEPGWYWLKKRDRIVELDHDPDGRLSIVSCAGRLIPCPFDEEFSGPLEKPDE